MAGWSMLADHGSSVNQRKKKLESFEMNEREPSRGDKCGVGVRYRESLSRSRPLPVLIGNGEPVDLLRLFVHVKDRGGYDVVSRDGLWEKVGEDQGLNCSGLGSAIKLVYCKYFRSPEKTRMNNSEAMDVEASPMFGTEALGRVFIGLGDNLKSYASTILEDNKKRDESEEGSTNGDKLRTGETNSGSMRDETGSERSGLSNNKKDCINAAVHEAQSADNVVKRASNSERSLRENGGDERGVVAGVPFLVNGDSSCKKRKRPNQLRNGADLTDDVVKTSSGRFPGAIGGQEKEIRARSSFFINDEGSSQKRKCLLQHINVGDEEDNNPFVVDGEVTGQKMKRLNELVNDAGTAREVVNCAKITQVLSKANGGDEREKITGHSFVVNVKGSSQSGKKPSCLGMLQWLAFVAKDPANPLIEVLPEKSKWRSYSNDRSWKQVLSAREALFLKKPDGLNLEEFYSQKMHPSMYDDPVHPSSAERVRSSRRLVYGSSFLNHSFSNLCSAAIYKRIPVGPYFQAEVPEWTGKVDESDSKWLGTRTWPPKKSEPMSLLEWTLTSKTTRDPCGCRFPGSAECIKFHISRSRMKLKVELGSVFYEWKFDKMGEDAAVSWTTKEEQKFESVVKENPMSQGKCFWDELSNSLPNKRRAELVSYYFNVFLLRRRERQNRYCPSDVDSDDDETEFIAKSSSLILSPGKKANRTMD